MSSTLIEQPAMFPNRSCGPAAIYRIDPLRDARWAELLEKHPRASVFHSTAWLEALRRTYGYEPVVYTTSSPDERLENGVAFCRVESWLTGRRLVSVPFSDHCEPLLGMEEEREILEAVLQQEMGTEQWRYIEIRPLQAMEPGSSAWRAIATYTLHQLDLSADLDALFANFHKQSTQRKVRRAERESLTYVEGRTAALLDQFYGLLTITRRRHRVPPQPKMWFRNLIDCFGEALKIRLALKDGQPLAGMLTLRYKDTLVYKYGASDVRFNKLGGVHLLYWKSIQEAKNSGLRRFDLGRTDAHQAGLITFKSRWGTTQSTLTYSRLMVSGNVSHVFDPGGSNWKVRMAKQVFAHAPMCSLSLLGSLLYKHVG